MSRFHFTNSFWAFSMYLCKFITIELGYYICSAKDIELGATSIQEERSRLERWQGSKSTQQK